MVRAAYALRTGAAPPWTGWALGWTFGPGRTAGQMWNASFAQRGTAVTAKNAGWNGTVAPGGLRLLRLHRKLDRRQPRPRRLHPRRCAVRAGLTAPPSGGP
ncbi:MULTISPECIES: cellulose binding domain-containing protein [Streptomyces]|uniref:cellulose binding domain-containing protein n=1 Tax=Streptomyces TaxID=1883 RepID=UPI000B29DE45